MAHAVLDDEFPIDFCARCRGVLFPRPTFAAVTTKRRAWATTPTTEPVPPNPRELDRRLRCPKCSSHFGTYPHYGPGNVVIDNCTSCDLIWLDFGEMRKIVDAPGRDRGSRNVLRADERVVRRGSAEPQDGEDEDQSIGAGSEAELLSFLLDVIFGD
jgi:Zn-finger nucleic acid-binding protein